MRGEKYVQSMQQISELSDLRLWKQMESISRDLEQDVKTLKDNKYNNFLQKYGSESGEFTENLLRCNSSIVSSWQVIIQTARSANQEKVQSWFKFVQQSLESMKQRQNKIQSQRKKKQLGILWDKVSAVLTTAGGAAQISGNQNYSIGCFGFALLVIFVSFCCLKK